MIIEPKPFPKLITWPFRRIFLPCCFRRRRRRQHPTIQHQVVAVPVATTTCSWFIIDPFTLGALILPQMTCWDIGLESGPKLMNKILDLCNTLEIPTNFKNDGLSTEKFDFIVKNCRSNSMTGNPREMPDDEVYKLLESLS